MHPSCDGGVTINATQADKERQWNFPAAPAVAGAKVEIDGQPAGFAATLAQRGYHILVITPAKPSVSGARLAALAGSVSSTPEK